MNKIILMGRLTRDPEMRYSTAAEPVAIARYTLAVNRRFKREGEPDADFINCVSFRNQAEFAQKYFQRGSMVAVSGSLQIRQFDDKNGARQYFTEVLVDDQYFAESKASSDARRASGGGGGFDMNVPPGVGGGSGGFDMNVPPSQFGGGNDAPAAPKTPPASQFTPIEGGLDDEDLPF